MNNNKPFIGRVVHFIHPASREHWPAMITRVWSDECVNLHVLPDNGPAFCVTSIELDTEREEPRSWHWPEKTE